MTNPERQAFLIARLMTVDRLIAAGVPRPWAMIWTRAYGNDSVPERRARPTFWETGFRSAFNEYHARELVPGDTPDLSAIWRDAPSWLPEGWQLDSLRCASDSLDPAERSTDWFAVSIGPEGVELSVRGATADDAVAGLREKLRG